MVAMAWPGVTVAPSSTEMVSTPSAGDDTSTATLSVSISTSSSSFLTVSPLFLVHLPMVPSATLSPMVGTATVRLSPAPPDAMGASARTGSSALGASALAAGAVFAAWEAVVAAAPAPPSDTTPSTAPGVTVSPSANLISPSTPSAGATTSRETLSVSSSTSISSFFTGSPAFLVHLAIVASVTDSPRVGVRMSAMSGPAAL